MILPPDWAAGAAFSDASDGDLRGDATARLAASTRLGIGPDWATLTQVHGSRVLRVDAPGNAGEADAIWTRAPGLPVAVFTADCYPVVLLADEAAGVAHAGWRGAVSGVVSALRDAMATAGSEPDRALVGPGIGPCCFEVGAEVSDLFPDFAAETTWGTRSVDLGAAIAAGLPGLEVWSAGGCSRHEDRFLSHRADGTAARMAGVAWL